MICLSVAMLPGSCGRIANRAYGTWLGIVMLTLQLGLKKGKPLRVLCLGAHSDDIEIGCGGTILKLGEERSDIVVHWIVFSSSEKRKLEAEESAHAFLKGVNDQRVTVLNFRDGFFPYIGDEIKMYFEELKHKVSPDLIFTHYRSDLHQDHRAIADLTWNTFRDHLILEYEIPKYDGDLGCPNVFVHLTHSTCDLKIKYILKHFESQRDNQWFGEETFRSLLRIRGLESNAPDKYAEAFYSRKIICDSLRS
jgi:LmbE family N-acetylglucosaminyl deacetylase